MFDEVTARKEAVRRLLRSKRRSIDPALHATRSLALCNALDAFGVWSTATRVAAFVGVRGEPDTRTALMRVLQRGQRLCLPRVHDEIFELAEVASLERLVPGVYGIPEPASGPPVSLREIGAMLVPGLAFSRTGARLGSGKGFYDRHFEDLDREVRPLLIGVCFDEFLDPEEGSIPEAAHDQRVDVIVTDLRIVSCAAA